MKLLGAHCFLWNIIFLHSLASYVDDTVAYTYDVSYIQEPCETGRIITPGQGGWSRCGIIKADTDPCYDANLNCSILVNASLGYHLTMTFQELAIDCDENSRLTIAGEHGLNLTSYCGFSTDIDSINSSSNWFGYKFKTYAVSYCQSGFSFYYTAYHIGECSADEFRCSYDGRCIPIEVVCDTYNNCGDWSDEGTDVCNGGQNCFTHDPGVNTIDGLFSHPHNENRPHTFYFGYLVGMNDANGSAECQSRCSAEPPCYSYTFISNSYRANATWMGECMGRSDEYNVSEPFQYAISGERFACGESETTTVAGSPGYTQTTPAPTSEPATFCNGTSYHGPTGVISSPNYPGNYTNYFSCDYYVNASSPSSSIAIIFKAFDTEECCDNVTVSCATNPIFPSVRYSGSFLPQPFCIPWCSEAVINFVTNNVTVSTGFSLDYHISLGGCGDTVYTGSHGYVSSPNYPNGYEHDQNCSNIIWSRLKSSFAITFQYMNVEECCDFVELSCLDNAESGSHRFTGTSIPTKLEIPRCTQVLVWFYSDDSVVHEGFNLEYIATPDPDNH